MAFFSNKLKILSLEQQLKSQSARIQSLEAEISELSSKLNKLSRIDLLINSQEIQTEINKIIDYCIKTKIINQNLLKTPPKK